MEAYKIKDSDIHEILNQHGLIATNIKKYTKSGQRQVFEITFNTGYSSVLKFVDVSPRFTYEDISDLPVEEYSQAIKNEKFIQAVDAEIMQRSARVLRELKASKKCSILPQLEILGDYELFKKEQNVFLYYFETKFTGTTLKESALYQQGQDIDIVIDFIYQMVTQIRVMYESGFVHRDLKPQNIIYDSSTFKVIDAGLIKSHLEGEDDSLTQTFQPLGTPRYWAPEQARIASNISWDFKTDLFPVGLMAMELFLKKTQQLPRKELLDLHFIYKMWQAKDNSPRSKALFTKVISKLANERHRRFSDLDALLVVLENMMNEEEDK